MTGPKQPPPPGVDPSQPSAARVYDYLLDGTDNYPSDRQAGEMIKARAPELREAAYANRSFHRRAARWLAEQGIAQFIDIGSGLPTAGNTHEVVRPVNPGARVAYVDNDPMVASYGGELLTGDEAATVILADLRDPDEVLGSPELRAIIDLGQPVAVLMTAVMHFVSDGSDPYGLIDRYKAALAPGSYLTLSHMTGEFKPPQAVQALLALGQLIGSGAYLRNKDEVRPFFSGLELVPPYPGADPDVTFVGLWACDDPELADSDDSRWLYCGVGRRLA
jgi:S-adenosyl methyltransferase